MKKILFLFLPVALAAQVGAQTRYQKDFDFYWKTVNDNFAYFQRQKTDWKKVKEIYQPMVDTTSSIDAFIHVLEAVNNELYNGHVFLNTNRSSSNRLVPSGADMKVDYKDGRYFVTEIRAGFSAEECGIQTGMQVTKFNDLPIAVAVSALLPKSIAEHDNEMYAYAANFLLAGTHDKPRAITVITNEKEKTFYPDASGNKSDEPQPVPLRYKKLPGNIGYINVLNSLGNDELIAAFDSAVNSLAGTKGLIIDLRETPGGGTTTIARAMMGRFISREQPYQKHIYSAEEKETGIRRSTLELVSPRGVIYKKPLVVLVGYWTASMGEGIAIAIDGMKRATVAGSSMAGLLGEIYTFRMPETNIPFSFPCVQLQHINGTPRENFMPAVRITDQKKAINTAIDLLSK